MIEKVRREGPNTIYMMFIRKATTRLNAGPSSLQHMSAKVNAKITIAVTIA